MTWKLSNASLLFNVMTLLTDTNEQTFWLFITCQVAGNFKFSLERNLVRKLELKQLSTADCMISEAYCSFYTCTHFTHTHSPEKPHVSVHDDRFTTGSKARGKHSMEKNPRLFKQKDSEKAPQGYICSSHCHTPHSYMYVGTETQKTTTTKKRETFS